VIEETFPAVYACALAILGGAVLQARDVSAGRGLVVDWRSTRSGEVVQDGCDAFDAAQLFVALVGPDAAFAAATVDGEPAPPDVCAYAPRHDGARRRSFEIGGFRVYVEPHEDDAAQAAFTGRLAAFARRAT
jgi:hypothetical protein